MVRVRSHEGISCNELADRIANAAREGHLISAVGPSRFSVSPEVTGPVDDDDKIHACRGASFRLDGLGKRSEDERIDHQGWQA